MYGNEKISQFSSEEVKLAGAVWFAQSKDKSFDPDTRSAFFDLLEGLLIEGQLPVCNELLEQVYKALVAVYSQIET